MSEELPQKIVAIKTTTYDVGKAIDDIIECFEKPKEDVTLDEVLQWVSDWAIEDLSQKNTIFFLDENGTELGVR